MISWPEFFQLDWGQLEWSRPWWALLAMQPLLMMLLLRLRHMQVQHYADARLLPWVLRGAGQGGEESWKRLLNPLSFINRYQ